MNLRVSLWVQGSSALPFLQRVACNNVDVDIGHTVYTALLNDRGCFESDVTIARLGQDNFLLVTGTAQLTKDMHWLKSHLLSTESNCHLSDVTSLYAVISVMGPHAEQVLQPLTSNDLSFDAFPPTTIKDIELGYAMAKASRRSYMGEDGWEFYVPTETAAYTVRFCFFT